MRPDAAGQRHREFDFSRRAAEHPGRGWSRPALLQTHKGEASGPRPSPSRRAGRCARARPRSSRALSLALLAHARTSPKQHARVVRPAMPGGARSPTRRSRQFAPLVAILEPVGVLAVPKRRERRCAGRRNMATVSSTRSIDAGLWSGSLVDISITQRPVEMGAVIELGEAMGAGAGPVARAVGQARAGPVEIEFWNALSGFARGSQRSDWRVRLPCSELFCKWKQGGRVVHRLRSRRRRAAASSVHGYWAASRTHPQQAIDLHRAMRGSVDMRSDAKACAIRVRTTAADAPAGFGRLLAC